MQWTKRTGIMLAYPFEEKRISKWEPPYIIQPKLDGDRCRAIIDNLGICTLLSSEENIISSVPHINRALEELGLHDFEFDGELYTHNMSHQDIHSRVSRTTNLHPDFESIEYHIFDYVGEDIQGQRLYDLMRFLPKTHDKIRPVRSHLAYSFNDILDIYDKIIRDGYEGIIIRNAYAPYLRKRVTSMMKFKPRSSDLYTIIGAEEEVDQYGTPKNSLGAFILRSDEGTQFKVGTGPYLTRDARFELWKKREDIIGHIAEVAYQHLTERRVPRFPVLMTIHPSGGK